MRTTHLFRKTLVTLALGLVLSGCDKPAPSADQSAPESRPMTSEKSTSVAGDYLTRDVRDDNFYFVLPDRFNNGNPDNDNGSKDKVISQGGLDTTSKWAFHGGDIAGLEQKLDYLQNMGITAIWLTPILRNQAIQWGGFGHHGYWIVDFTEIDPHFGSNDDLKSLINAAHKKDMKIFFDIITNHTADIIRYEECHNEDGTFKGERTCEYKSMEQLAGGDTYTPFVPEKFKGVKYPEWLNDPKYYNNQGDSFWRGESAINGDFAGLDDLNTRMPEVVDGMIDIYKNIITEFKPDGFRIDTVKHVDMSFWQEFAPAIIDHAKSLGIPNFHIFGEVYDGNPVVLSSFTTSGKLPSVLDFGFQHAAAEVFYRGNDPAVVATLFDNDDYYSDHDSQADLLMNFLGNHDMGRTGHFIEKAMPDISDEEKVQRSIVSHALMYFSRGIPVIYYGDEQGFTGDGGDVDAREDMFASEVDVYNDNNLIGTEQTTADNNFNPSHPIYQAVAELSALRMEHKALRRGVTFSRDVNGDSAVFALSRVDKDEQVEYLALFNSSTEAQEVTLSATAGNYTVLAGEGSVSVADQTVSATLPPLSYTLAKADEPLSVATNLELTLDSVTENDERVVLSFELPGADGNLPVLLTLDVSAQLDGKDTKLATDETSPYRVILLPEQYAELKGSSLTATVTNSEGKQQTHSVALPE